MLARTQHPIRHNIDHWSLSVAVARKVQNAFRHLRNFEDLLVEEAKRNNVDGVVCGHSHRPAMVERDGVLYCNTGDWTENCTALVEHTDGTLELIKWREVLANMSPSEDQEPTSQPRRRFVSRRPTPKREPLVSASTSL